MEVRMKIKITNERDADPPLVERNFDTIEVTYSEEDFDDNKMCRYGFVKRKGLEPIKLKAGQHLHITQSYYHRSTSERLHCGEDGEEFA
jgi:hypothetical protein